MKMIFKAFVCLLSSVCVFQFAEAELNLVLTFTESNIAGQTHNALGTGRYYSAGDVNGDGYKDLIIGADGYNSITGRAYLYFGGPSFDNHADKLFTGESVNGYFSYWLSGAGDFNHDGFDDIIISANNYGGHIGRVYLYNGGVSMDTITDVVMNGEAFSEFGCSVSSAGDLNQDGFDDILVGAHLYDSEKGRAYVFFGGNPADSIPDLILPGEGGRFGESVSNAGDVNGDGYLDFIVGAVWYNGTGRAYLYFGGADMDSIPDLILNGEGGNFGYDVTALNDINHDGYNDVAVGAPCYNNGTGRVYIYFGGASMDSVADLVLNGEDTDSNFGASVSETGDLNQDGFDDMIVGAYSYDSFRGRAYIYLGGPGMDENPDYILDGEGGQFGGGVCGVDDVNNDGFNEVLVVACEFGENGKAYLYSNVQLQDTLTMAVNNDGWGTTTPAIGDHTYNSGEVINITAIPAAGYTFVNWTGDVADPNSANTTVAMNGNRTVTANFQTVPITWYKYAGNPVLVPSDPSFDSYSVTSPVVLFDNGVYKMWYAGAFGTNKRNICYATSTNGLEWTKHGVALPYGSGWDGQSLHYPFVLKISENEYRMYYSGHCGYGRQMDIGMATSTDGEYWTRYGSTPIFPATTVPGADQLLMGSIVYIDNIFKMWFSGCIINGSEWQIRLATSSDGINWSDQGVVLEKGEEGEWDTSLSGGPRPFVVIRNGIYEMWYDGTNSYPNGDYSIGYAISSDGIHWIKHTSNPRITAGSAGNWDSKNTMNP
ncbi:FG-GAP-like repeat-containing protein [bacterium]|nr:FG-GAP-like repeat-containing protein [bacterium]